jgi:hypothetical protein
MASRNNRRDHRDRLEVKAFISELAAREALESRIGYFRGARVPAAKLATHQRAYAREVTGVGEHERQRGACDEPAITNAGHQIVSIAAELA